MSAAIFTMLISAGIYTGAWELPPLIIFAFAAIAGALIAWRIYASAEERAREKAELRAAARDQKPLAAGTQDVVPAGQGLG
jgi:hypothetical protein